MFNRRLVITLAMGVSLAVGMSFPWGPAMSADFPKKPVRLMVTAAVGGGEDGELRGFTPFLQKHVGVSIFIENVPGAGGKIAFEKMQKTEPDGYTLMFTTFPKPITVEYMEKVNYRSKDFTPVFAWSWSNQILVVNIESWKTFDEFLKAAKTKPLAGAFTGRGSTAHVAGLLAADALGIKVNWVPYEGSGETLAALAGKHIDFVVSLAPTCSPLIDAGKLRPLIMFADERDPYFPDVPVPKDLGFRIPTFPAIRGLVAPPQTPAAIVKIWEEALSKALKEPGYIDWTKKRGMVISPAGPQEFGKIIMESYPKMEKIHQMLKE